MNGETVSFMATSKAPVVTVTASYAPVGPTATAEEMLKCYDECVILLFGMNQHVIDRQLAEKRLREAVKVTTLMASDAAVYAAAQRCQALLAYTLLSNTAHNHSISDTVRSDLRKMANDVVFAAVRAGPASVGNVGAIPAFDVALAHFVLGQIAEDADSKKDHFNACTSAVVKASEEGNVIAAAVLGACYLDGIGGVPADPALGVKWLTKAAEEGHAIAQYNLAICYECGKGVAKDEVKAVEWYTRAAQQGHSGAQCNLGVCLETGRGVQKDKSKAVEYYVKAGENGHVCPNNEPYYLKASGHKSPSDNKRA